MTDSQHIIETLSLGWNTIMLAIAAYFLRDIHMRFRQHEKTVNKHETRIAVLETVVDNMETVAHR